jgi:hypothetical protein
MWLYWVVAERNILSMAYKCTFVHQAYVYWVDCTMHIKCKYVLCALQQLNKPWFIWFHSGTFDSENLLFANVLTSNINEIDIFTNDFDEVDNIHTSKRN